MRRAARPGFSLVEILVAMTLTLAVFAITLPFVRAQSRSLSASAGRLDAEQIARYAQRVIDRDLRLAGAAPEQPLIVHAAPMALSFNANLLAPDSTDREALEIESGAPATLTEAWTVATAAVLPRSTRAYPVQDYQAAGGGLSRHETISYFLHPDTVTTQADLYVLYRRVNARDSVALVRALHVPPDSSFFSYYVAEDTILRRLAAAELPLFWDSTRVADVRVVGIRATGYFRNRMDGSVTFRTVDWRSPLPERRMLTATPCRTTASAPAAPSNVQQSKAVGGNPGPPLAVTVSWSASGDDDGSVDNVAYYVLLNRLASVTPVAWHQIAWVPARGASAYQFNHALPMLVGGVKYGVVAVDCAGNWSTVASHASNLTLP